MALWEVGLIIIIIIIMAGNRRIVCHSIEISTLGFISNISDFTKAAQIAIMPDDLKRSIVKTVVNSSFNIYCNRNNSALDAA